jgi:hypothetical protein
MALRATEAHENAVGQPLRATAAPSRGVLRARCRWSALIRPRFQESDLRLSLFNRNSGLCNPSGTHAKGMTQTSFAGLA